MDDPFGDAFDALGDAFSDAADVVVDAASSVGDAASNLAESAFEGLSDAAGGLGSAFSDATGVVSDAFGVVDDIGSTIDDATGGAFTDAFDAVSDASDFMLQGIEESGIFDVIDVATVGIIDLSYENGNLGLDFGIDGIAGYSVSLGSDGFSGSAEIAGQGADLHLGAGGFNAGLELGWDLPGMPYVSGHAGADANGNFGFEVDAQGYLPLPGLAVGGEVQAMYQETDDGFISEASLTGRVFVGTAEAAAGVHGAYSEDADGYHANVGVHAEVGIVGGPHVTAQVDYDEGREGDEYYYQGSAKAGVHGFGADAEVETTYRHTDGPDGSTDEFSAHASGSIGGLSGEAGVDVTVGPDGEVEASAYVDGELPDDVSDAVDVASKAIDDVSGGELSEIKDMVPEDVADAAADKFDDVLDSLDDDL